MKYIDLEWLAGKSDAEQRQLLDDSGISYSGAYPHVNAEEAAALRDGKPYKLTDFDIERLNRLFGFDGNPNTDPFVIKCLAKGYIVENPSYIAEVEAYKMIADAQATYGPGEYGFGVDFINRRWILTEAGRAFKREVSHV